MLLGQHKVHRVLVGIREMLCQSSAREKYKCGQESTRVMLPGVFGNQTRLDGLLMGDESVWLWSKCVCFFFFGKIL